MTWGRTWRNLALVVLFAALLLVPPSVLVNGTNDVASCRALGLEWREPVLLSRTLTDSGFDAVDNYVAEVGSADASEAQARMAVACADARQDRQTLIMVVGFVVLGWLVVRHGSRPSAARVEGQASGEPSEGPVT